MYRIIDSHDVILTKADMDNLFYELNKELRKKLRKMPRDYKADLYVVGGACVVATLGSRDSTTDIDAMWTIGAEMRECINAVGDRLNLGHTWCNCDFKRTKSYTNAIIYNSTIYKTFDRLVVRMVNYDLLLAMKLVAFREHKKTDELDCINIVNYYKSKGVNLTTESLINLVNKYFSINDLSVDAKRFIGMRC